MSIECCCTYQREKMKCDGLCGIGRVIDKNKLWANDWSVEVQLVRYYITNGNHFTIKAEEVASVKNKG